jgi:hypothetical protein
MCFKCIIQIQIVNTINFIYIEASGPVKPFHPRRSLILHPVHVHGGDADHAHGVTFPDFPGRIAAVDDWSDLPADVQEALEAHFSETPPQNSEQARHFIQRPYALFSHQCGST